MMAGRSAAWLMVAQSALFAAETAAIHQTGAHASVVLLSLVRGAAGVGLAAALAWHGGIAVARTRQLPLQLLRGGVSLLYLWMMIYAFARLPYADATAISFTQAAYIPVFAVIILGEKVLPVRWATTALAVAGALLIARPAFAGWDSVYLIALFGAILNALAFVLNRYLQRADSEATTLFYTSLVGVVGNIPFLAAVACPGVEQLPSLGGVLLLGPLGVYLGIAAVRRAPAAALGPFTLLRLVIGIAGGALVFGELPTLPAVFGASLILLGCVSSHCSVTLPGKWTRSRRYYEVISGRGGLSAPSRSAN